MKHLLLGLLAAALLVGCGGGGTGGETTGNTPATKSPAVQGVVMKSGVAAAQVQLFALDSNGLATGSAIATALTDSTGAFSINRPSNAPALLAVTSGGSFVDEADPETDLQRKRKIQLSESEHFESLLPAGANSLVITPYTNALLLRARALAAPNRFLATFTALNNQATSAFGFDPIQTVPTSPISPAANANAAQKAYALVIGGFAQVVQAQALELGTFPTYAIIQGCIQDLSDGRIDGRNNQQNVLVLVNGVSKALDTKIAINAQIKRFKNNNATAYQDIALVSVNEDQLSQTPNNAAPQAVADSFTTQQGTPVSGNVLSNDSDPEGTELTAILITQPSNGSLQLQSNGSFTYTPTTTFSGTDQFSYQASDGSLSSATAAVTITVNPNTSNLMIDAGPTQSVSSGTTVRLQGSISSSNQPPQIRWQQILGPTVTLSDASALQPTFVAPNVVSGRINLRFRITATYSNGQVISDETDIEVFSAQIVNGVLRVTLSWSADGDVDLYLRDPTGRDINYFQLASRSGGYLDIDDTEKRGPENITWLNNAPDGTYCASFRNRTSVTQSTEIAVVANGESVIRQTIVAGSDTNSVAVVFTKSGSRYQARVATDNDRAICPLFSAEAAELPMALAQGRGNAPRCTGFTVGATSTSCEVLANQPLFLGTLGDGPDSDSEEDFTFNRAPNVTDPGLDIADINPIDGQITASELLGYCASKFAIKRSNGNITLPSSCVALDQNGNPYSNPLTKMQITAIHGLRMQFAQISPVSSQDRFGLRKTTGETPAATVDSVLSDSGGEALTSLVHAIGRISISSYGDPNDGLASSGLIIRSDDQGSIKGFELTDAVPGQGP